AEVAEHRAREAFDAGARRLGALIETSAEATRRSRAALAGSLRTRLLAMAAAANDLITTEDADFLIHNPQHAPAALVALYRSAVHVAAIADRLAATTDSIAAFWRGTDDIAE